MSATALAVTLGGGSSPATATPKLGSDDGHGRFRPIHHCAVMLPPDRPPVAIRSWTMIWARPVGQLRWGDRLRASCTVTYGGHYGNWQCGSSNRWVRVTQPGRMGYVPLGCVRWFSPSWPPWPIRPPALRPTA